MVGYKEYRESKNARLLIFEVTGDPEQLPWEKIKSSQGQEISLVVSEVLDTEAEDFEAETLGIIEDVDDHKWTITVKLEEEIYKQLSDLSSGYKLPGAGFLFTGPNGASPKSKNSGGDWRDSSAERRRTGIYLSLFSTRRRPG